MGVVMPTRASKFVSGLGQPFLHIHMGFRGQLTLLGAVTLALLLFNAYQRLQQPGLAGRPAARRQWQLTPQPASIVDAPPDTQSEASIIATHGTQAAIGSRWGSSASIRTSGTHRAADRGEGR